MGFLTPLRGAMRYAAIELGGTSIRLAVAEGRPENIVAQTQMRTTGPAADIPEMLALLDEHRPFAGLGIASFGPIDPKKGSPTYGHITTTPKLAWANVDIVCAMRPLGVPVVFDTDVNAPALNEYRLAKERG